VKLLKYHNLYVNGIQEVVGSIPISSTKNPYRTACCLTCWIRYTWGALRARWQSREQAPGSLRENFWWRRWGKWGIS